MYIPISQFLRQHLLHLTELHTNPQRNSLMSHNKTARNSAKRSFIVSSAREFHKRLVRYTDSNGNKRTQPEGAGGDCVITRFTIRTPQQILFGRTIKKKPFPVAALSQAWDCGRSLVGVAGSNRAGDMDACLL